MNLSLCLVFAWCYPFALYHALAICLIFALGHALVLCHKFTFCHAFVCVMKLPCVMHFHIVMPLLYIILLQVNCKDARKGSACDSPFILFQFSYMCPASLSHSLSISQRKRSGQVLSIQWGFP